MIPDLKLMIKATTVMGVKVQLIYLKFHQN